MSDEFLKIARKEIQEELNGIDQILSTCTSDSDISNNGKNIERHLHKIKGLAPMMGQEEVGEIAKIMDAVLKHVIANGTLDGTYKALLESQLVMKEIFNDSNKTKFEEFKKKTVETFSKILN